MDKQTAIRDNPTNTDKMVLTIPELAQELGVCEKTAYILANSDGFPSFRLGRRLLTPRDALKDWLNKQVSPRFEGRAD